METSREDLAKVIRSLGPGDRDAYELAYYPKSDDTFFALTWVLGGLGVNYFYLGNACNGWARIVLSLLLLALAIPDVFLVGVCALVANFACWLHDILFHTRIVERANWQRKAAALHSIGRLPAPNPIRR